MASTASESPMLRKAKRALQAPKYVLAEVGSNADILPTGSDGTRLAPCLGTEL
jgi:hypothetical protein